MKVSNTLTKLNLYGKNINLQELGSSFYYHEEYFKDLQHVTFS